LVGHFVKDVEKFILYVIIPLGVYKIVEHKGGIVT